MTELISIKRKWISIIQAWLIFIGVDFLFHASIFATLWKEDIPALKTLIDLAVLIPAGYFSFLLLTSLIGYVFFKVFITKPPLKSVVQFGFIFAVLFSMSNFLGLFSYINLPIKQLIVFNLIYFLEIFVVILSFYYTSFRFSVKKSIFYSFLLFFSLIIIGILIQNIY